MHGLPLFVRLSGQPVMLLGEGEAADAKRRLIERAGGIIVDESDETARIAFIAINGPEDVAVRLKARGILVNVVDRPDLCDFTTPAIIDRDPVLIAIGTGGASAGLAAALRQRIEALLPARLGDLAQALCGARSRMRALWPDAATRRRALGQALAPGGTLDPMSEAPDVEQWLESGAAQPAAMLYTLVLRTADPDDLTLRDARMLAQADTILHPPGTPEAIMERARADALRLPGDGPEVTCERPGLTVHINITPM